jgi:hypothetical protein
MAKKLLDPIPPGRNPPGRVHEPCGVLRSDRHLAGRRRARLRFVFTGEPPRLAMPTVRTGVDFHWNGGRR